LATKQTPTVRGERARKWIMSDSIVGVAVIALTGLLQPAVG
jgi:hypothetical protein